MPAPYGLNPSHPRYLVRVNVVCFEELGSLGLTVRVKSDWDEVGDNAKAARQIIPLKVELEEEGLDVGVGA